MSAVATTRTEKKTDEVRTGLKWTLEEARTQLLTYQNMLHDYLEHVQADIEQQKFSVERHGNEVDVEVHFKAHLHPKTKEPSKEVPK